MTHVVTADSPPILSARVALNAPVFNDVLKLFVPSGARVLDATYGRGMFWKEMPRTDITLVRGDLCFGKPDVYLDFTRLPFCDACFHAIVLDPPYATTKSPTHTRGKAGEGFAYGLAGGTESKTRMTNEDNVELYRRGATEARRCLIESGVLILKTQDDGTFWKHIPLMQLNGFACEDLFVVVNPRQPVWDPRWKIQRHARKNHSYFLVLRKVGR